MTHTIERRAGAAWSVRRRRGFWGGIMVIAALAAASGAEASTYRWQVDASGNWNDAANWAVVEGPAGAGYPNLAGDVAVFDEPRTATRTIIIPDTVTITIGQLTVTSSNAAGQVVVTHTGTGLLVFDNLGEDALLETSGPGGRTIMSTAVQLAAHLNVNGPTDFRVISEAGGSRNVTIAGGSVTFVEPNTYTGTTTVPTAHLRRRRVSWEPASPERSSSAMASAPRHRRPPRSTESRLLPRPMCRSTRMDW